MNDLVCMKTLDLAWGFVFFGSCFLSYEIGRLIQAWHMKDKK